ncbi:MAG: MBL fold metallo-hydrolase [Slackia sp.]|nr:MBL fold metallo-hydrolase [Slackia sp.]
MLSDFCERVWEDPEVYRIRLPFFNLGAGESNCFVLHDEGEWLIVDTGAPTVAACRRLLSAFAALGVDFSRCKAFMTHAHFDHVGLLDGVLPRSVPVYMSEAGFSLHMPEGERRVHDSFLRRMMACGVSFDDACAYAVCNAEPVKLDVHAASYRFISAGDVISVGKHRFCVVDTAGHTPDHQVLYDAANGLLFGGDHVLFDVAPAVDAFPESIDGLGLYLANLHKVHSMPVAAAFLGHGDVVCEGLAERADAIAAKKMRRCERLFDAVERNPGMTGEALACGVLARKDEASWRALPALSRYYFLLDAFVCLQHLYAMGCVKRVPGDADVVWRYIACAS